MSSLMIVDESKISKKAREEIDLGIKRALEGVNKNGQLALLTLNSVTALTSGKARWKELREQGMLTRMFRTITGKNRAIRQACSMNSIIKAPKYQIQGAFLVYSTNAFLPRCPTFVTRTRFLITYD